MNEQYEIEIINRKRFCLSAQKEEFERSNTITRLIFVTILYLISYQKSTS